MLSLFVYEPGPGTFSFGAIGNFYALGERIGSSPSEAFLGLEILFDNIFKDVLAIEQFRTFPSPVLDNALEPFEALYGAPLLSGKLQLQDYLEELGYIEEGEALHYDKPGNFAIFKKAASHDEAEKLLYVSDGLRHHSGGL